MRPLSAWLAQHAARTPDKTAIRFGDKRISYAALHRRTCVLSKWLIHDQGLAPGSRLAWLGHNSPDMLALLFACAAAHTVLVPLNWRLSAEELNEVINDATASRLLVDESCADLGDALETTTAKKLALPSAELTPNAASSQPAAHHGANSDAADLAVLQVYTSGTTGQPKGAVLTQQALLFNALNAVHMHEMSAADRVFTALPMFHVGGLNIQTLPALYCGAEVILEPRFEPARAIDIIRDLKPTLTVLVPATLSALINLPAWPDADLSSLRSITTGSTDVPRSLIDQFHARDVAVIQVYGATETGPLAIYQQAHEAITSAGSIGRAGLHSEIRLADNAGQAVGANTPGEIWVRGPHVANGYWDRQSRTSRPFDDGWFRSGDIATMDNDGVYWFTDRKKHVIISGGENIYPAELERVLDHSGLFKEAAVVGRSDKRWGEVPVVVAVRREPELTEMMVRALFEGKLARYKHPQAVFFCDALPRNAMGKVKVAEVREMLNAKEC